MPTLSTACAHTALTTDPPMLPKITCGDASSVVFVITKGTTLASLKASKAKMDSGEIKSCEGTFTVKYALGETCRSLSSGNVCEVRLSIDIIDETSRGLQIAGRVNSVSYGRTGGRFQSGTHGPRNEACRIWATELNRLRKGALVKMLYRGAGSEGAITYINNPDEMTICYPYVPSTLLATTAYTAPKRSANSTPIRSHGYAVTNGRCSMPRRI